MRKLYVAYGSNLNVQQMGYRCPSAEVVTTGKLHHWRLKFKGSKTGSYLTIEPEIGQDVPVALWSVTDADIRNLDIYEGYPSFYYKRWIKVKCDDGKWRKAFVYIMHEERTLGIPTPTYVGTCASGYQEFGFDLKYLRDAIQYSKEGIIRERFVGKIG